MASKPMTDAARLESVEKTLDELISIVKQLIGIVEDTRGVSRPGRPTRPHLEVIAGTGGATLRQKTPAQRHLHSVRNAS